MGEGRKIVPLLSPFSFGKMVIVKNYIYVAVEWLDIICEGLRSRYLRGAEVRAWLREMLLREVWDRDAKVVWCELKKAKGGSRWKKVPVELVELLILYRVSNLRLRIILVAIRNNRGSLFNLNVKAMRASLKSNLAHTYQSLNLLKELELITPLKTPKKEEKFFGKRYAFSASIRKRKSLANKLGFFGFQESSKSKVYRHDPYWYRNGMNYYDELVKLLRDEGRYYFVDADSNPSKHFKFIEFNSDGGMGAHVYDVLEDAMRHAFKLGHAQGALATLESLPENVKELYDFNKELDSALSERTWDKVKGEIFE